MIIELVSFTFEKKLDMILKYKINPVIYSNQNNTLYQDLYFYFEYLFEFTNIANIRQRKIIEHCNNNNLLPFMSDLFLPTIDYISYNSLIKSAYHYNKYRRRIFSNKHLYNTILSELLKICYGIVERKINIIK